MAKILNLVAYKSKPKKSRPGVEAKTKSSKNKASKLYKKPYKGQGK